MTRINLIDPALLTTEHLGAEYRELPRVYGYVKALCARGLRPEDIRIPATYRLGRGHVTFFYDKLDWLTARYLAIVVECRHRGRAVNFGDPSYLTEGIVPSWFNYWEPSAYEISLSLDRLIERGGLKKGFVFPHSLIQYHTAMVSD